VNRDSKLEQCDLSDDYGFFVVVVRWVKWVLLLVMTSRERGDVGFVSFGWYVSLVYLIGVVELEGTLVHHRRMTLLLVTLESKSHEGAQHLPLRRWNGVPGGAN